MPSIQNHNVSPSYRSDYLTVKLSFQLNTIPVNLPSLFVIANTKTIKARFSCRSFDAMPEKKKQHVRHNLIFRLPGL